MKKFLNYFIFPFTFFNNILIIQALIPNWDFNSHTIDLLESSVSHQYNIFNDTKPFNTTLYKDIKKDSNGMIKIKNYLIVNSNKKEVPFEDINSVFQNKLGCSILICPKGNFHPFDFNNNKNITQSDFKEDDNWDLRCYSHDTGYFLIIYLLNQKHNFYFYESGEFKKSSNILNSIIFSYQLEQWKKEKNYKYKFITMEKKDNSLILYGRNIIMNSGEKNLNSPNSIQTTISESGKYSQCYFDTNKIIHYFTYNNIYDFLCGYSSSVVNLDNFDNIPNVEFKKKQRSPLSFIDKVEIEEMKFIVGTKYVYYKIKNINKLTYYYGLIDTERNLVLYNFEREEEFKSFIPYLKNGEMLAITSTSAYKICIIKSNNSCLTPCSNLLLDPDSNKCQTGCDTEKIKLMPEEICIKEELCNTTIYIKKEIDGDRQCGLCFYFNPDDDKYRLLGAEGCISTIPIHAEFYNTNLYILKCIANYHVENNSCIPDYCFDRCEKCIEISNNINDQKCTSCKSGFILNDIGNCEMVDIPIFNCTNKRCYQCSDESNKINLCLSCDNEIYGKVNYSSYYPKYIDCKKKETLEFKYYYDILTKQYKPCYEKCKRCLGPGNETFHNCLECEDGYMFRPWDNPKNNCVAFSKYYYRSPYNEYKPLNNPQCPSMAKYKIINNKTDKTSCIYDCKVDEEYKYLYNGNCIKDCSEIEGTVNNNFTCVENNPNKIYITTNPIYLDYSEDPLETIQTLAISYADEFNYTNKHISLYKNNNVTVALYKNKSIIGDTNLTLPNIDFGECYDKIKNYYNITQDLIIGIVEQKVKHNPSSFYTFFHPISGLKLETEEICQNDIIIIKENLLSMLDKENESYNLQAYLLKQGVNIYDIFDPYFTDICYEFDNNINRDISLRDRILEVYVNATLCDEGCINTGINLFNNEATCNCKYNDFTNDDLLHNNAALEALFGDFLELLSSTNLQVLKCYKNLIPNLKKSYGCMIVASLLALSIIFTILFFLSELTQIKKYIFLVTKKFCVLLKCSKLKNFFPPKKPINKRKNSELKGYPISERKNYQYLFKKDKLKKISTKNTISNSRHSQTISIDLMIYSKNSQNKINLELLKKNILLLQNLKKEKELRVYFHHYLLSSPDDLELDDAIEREKRTFCQYFLDSLKEKQSIAYTFLAFDPINPRAIKLILFCLNINLYFVVSGLFFNEIYISELYNIKEEDDNFLIFFERNLNKIIDSTIVGIVIGYLTDFFFFEEKKFKRILKREKNNITILKSSIVLFIKELEKRYIFFITISFVIFVISFYYILCFNYVYPKTQIEWIKASILITITMQIISFLSCLFGAIFRFLSFKFNSEKLYKFSKFLQN